MGSALRCPAHTVENVEIHALLSILPKRGPGEGSGSGQDSSETLQKPCKNKRFSRSRLCSKSYRVSRRLGRASRNPSCRKSTIEESLENQRKIMVSLLWRHGIATRIKHCIREAKCSGRIYEKHAKNLVKTNVSMENGFPANPTRAKPRLLDPFAGSNTGNVTINKHGNHSGKVCKTL